MVISKLEGVMSAKEKILDAALTLFAENGYDGTSVELLAAELNTPAVLRIARSCSSGSLFIVNQ